MKPFIYRIQFFLVIIALLAVPVFWSAMSRWFEPISIIEGRDLETFPDTGWLEVKRTLWLVTRGRITEARELLIDRVMDRSLQDQFTLATSDHFPLRLNLIRAAKGFDLGMIYSTYAFLPDRAVPTNTRNEIFITWDQSTVIKGLPLYDEQDEQALDARIAEISTIANQYPDINVYVFYFELLANSEQNPMLPAIPGLDGGRSYAYLKDHLPANVTLDAMLLPDVAEFNQDFYHTDHHWNIRGAWKAYQQMYTMVSANYPGISPINDSIQYKTFPDLLFLGTYARDSLYPFSPELFEIGEVELPQYVVMTRDYPIDYNKSEQYLAGVFSKNPYVSRYAEFFGENYPYMEYVFDNGASRNLLVIGTSYKIPIQPWIASHYYESYFVNVSIDPEFSLSEFMQTHHVDDLIILTDMDELLSQKDSIRP
jgi:hypothetical protein